MQRKKNEWAEVLDSELKIIPSHLAEYYFTCTLMYHYAHIFTHHHFIQKLKHGYENLKTIILEKSTKK